MEIMTIQSIVFYFKHAVIKISGVNQDIVSGVCSAMNNYGNWSVKEGVDFSRMFLITVL